MTSNLKDKLPKKYRKGVLTEVRRNTKVGKELSDVFAALIRDAGGFDNMTVGQMMLCERLTFLDVMLRAMERKIAEDPAGQPVLVGRWTQGVNALQGLIKTLGLDRDREDDVIDALYQEPEK